MGNHEIERIFSVPALGRPFRLGMFYDCRTETLIPGMTLWDQATLENKTEQQLKNSESLVMCSDSLDSKASVLEMDASLKLSFLGGLVDVRGAAAKYLHNKTSSSHEQNITLLYRCTTREDTVMMEHLKHPPVFDHGIATHVVTSIVYGAQALFTFHRKHSDTEPNVEDNAYAMIEKIPDLNINGEGELDMSEEEKKISKEFTCKYFGDLLMPKSPSSFLDAVKLYNKFPELLGTQGENAVPVKIQLYPLTLIDKKAPRLFREIRVSLVSEIETFFQEMNELSMKCNDILKSDAAQIFSDFRCQIQMFEKTAELCKKGIQKELCIMLPQIRNGGEEDKGLVELLNKINESPVSILSLRSWLKRKNTQTKVLDKYVSTMAGIKFATETSDLESEVMDPENIYTLCLTISVPSYGSQLETMKRYCLDPQFPSIHQKTDDSVTAQKINRRPMMEVAGGFKDLYNTNKKKGISFLVAQEFSESDAFHARVKCYKHGEPMSDDYELPSTPEKVKALDDTTTHNSITISWSPPKYGASIITSYVVSCCKDANEQVTSKVTVDRNENQVTIPGLAANTEYEVRVWATCEVGDGPVGDAEVIVKTKPADQPEMLRAMDAPADGCSVEQETKADLHTALSESKVEIFPNTVTVGASCGSDGLSSGSEICTTDLTKPTTSENLKHYICANSSVTPDNVQIYRPALKRVSSNSMEMFDRYEFGERKLGVQEKVIMLVGATGSGKTTLINGFVNYIFGVEWKDSFRFKMILEPNVANQAKSQTTKITLYTLHHMEGFKVTNTFTIIDTPGFGDVSGVMRDREITEDIREFFLTPSENGITHIDAVGFVANSSMPRLTPAQRYIFDQILSLFGKDIADNIFLLLTFADGKTPQVLSGIEEAEIPFKKYLKFNNSALYAFHDNECSNKEKDNNEQEDRSFDKMFWEMGFRSFSLFLEEIKFVESKSLLLTQNVLNERNRLHIYIDGIHCDIRQGLSTLNRLENEMEVLKTHQADIERNKNFEYEVEEEVYVTVQIGVGQFITNCAKCNRTCHEVCKISDDKDKIKCFAMTDGQCRICPNKCVWSVHRNMEYKYELTLQKTKKTFNELRERYEKATKGKLSTENLIEQINEEFEALQIKVIAMTNSVRKCIQRLEEIALRHNPMTTVQYLDILIESEKSEALPGWQARLEQLNNVRKETEYMEQIANQGFEPFKEYLEKLKRKQKKSKSGILERAIVSIKKIVYGK